jgi:hypothetical protein
MAEKIRVFDAVGGRRRLSAHIKKEENLFGAAR